MTLEGFDACADRHAAHWRAAELGEGARAVVVATPEPKALAAIVGAMRAGLEVTLAAPGLDAQGLAEGAREAGALALAGPGDFAGLDFAERLTEAAALSRSPCVGRMGRAPPPAPFVSMRRPIRIRRGRVRRRAVDRAARATADPCAGPGRARRVGRQLHKDGGAHVRRDRSVARFALQRRRPRLRGAGAARLGREDAVAGAVLRLSLLPGALERAPVHLVAPGAVVGELGRSGLLSHERVATLTLLVYGDFDPIFDHDLEPERVFLLETETTGVARLTPLSQAFGEDLE